MECYRKAADGARNRNTPRPSNFRHPGPTLRLKTLICRFHCRTGHLTGHVGDNLPGSILAHERSLRDSSILSNFFQAILTDEYQMKKSASPTTPLMRSETLGRKIRYSGTPRIDDLACPSQVLDCERSRYKIISQITNGVRGTDSMRILSILEKMPL